jgi:4-amino-4-deoxy-L-arabinose transferase-like glycosyltransferase
VYFVFFTVSRTKLPNYILPLYPAVALLLARFLERWRRGTISMSHRFTKICVVTLASVGLLTAIGMLVASGMIPTPLPKRYCLAGLRQWAILGLIPLIGAGLVGRSLTNGRSLAPLTVWSLTAIMFTAGIFALAMPALDTEKAAEPLARAVRSAQREPEVRIVAYRYFQPSLVFYCRRAVLETDDDSEVLSLLNYPVPVYVVTTAAEWQLLKSKTDGKCRVFASAHDLFRGEEVVAVTNR